MKTKIYNSLDKKEKPLIVLIVILGVQFVSAFLISKYYIPDNALSHLMYLPIIAYGYIFDYRIGILGGIIAELLIDVMSPAQIGLSEKQLLKASLLRVVYFGGVGLTIGLLKSKTLGMKATGIQTINSPSKRMFSTWEEFNDGIENKLDSKRIMKFRFILIEINNHNELMASFGLDSVKKLNDEIIQIILSNYSNYQLLQISLSTFALALFDIHQDIHKLSNMLEEPMIINGIPMYCEVSMGEASFPESAQSTEEILKNSYLALNDAKKHQKPYQQYNANLANPEIPILLGQFQNAIRNNEIDFFYQPIIDQNGTVISLEALVRWNHPVRGLIPPDHFIPDLEFTRITNFLTYYSLETNLDRMETLYQRGFNLDIALNISITNLFQIDFAERVIELIHKHHFPAHHLALEITERGFLADDPQCTYNLQALIREGIKISIDDFGVGFTSISNFRNKDISSIKIDKSFVDDIHINKSNQAIIEGIIAIAKSSHITVIAEGIEKKMEQDKLLELGVDCLQGYYISEPLNFKCTQKWLRGHISNGNHGKE